MQLIQKLKKFKFPQIPKKTIKIASGCLAAVLATGIALSVYAMAAAFSPVKLRLDVTNSYQTMEGFGMSAAWTFQELGIHDGITQEAAELLYGDDGMRLDVLRYNIGAGTDEVKNSYEDTRMAESFFDSDKYVDINSFYQRENYDFENRDVAAMNMLKACLQTGNVKTLVLFANSPHYLLTKNGKGNAKQPYTNNLPEENYEAFTQYLIIIADYFRTMLEEMELDVELYLSPVNEPQWRWGGSDATQEGCHFDPVPLGKFYNVFCNALEAYNRANHCNVVPDLFESGDYKLKSTGKTKFKEYINEFKKYNFYKNITHLSVHSYNAEQKTGMRKRFNSYAEQNLNGINIHMSEYCVMQAGISEDIDMGIYSAGVMMKDLTLFNASQWCWWLGYSDGEYEDGLVYYTYRKLSNPNTFSFKTTKRYSTLSQFTRYISRGDVRVDIDTPYTATGWDGIETCAFQKADGSIVIVLINQRAYERKVTLPAGYGVSEASYTDQTHDVAALNTQNGVKLPAESVVTLILKK